MITTGKELGELLEVLRYNSDNELTFIIHKLSDMGIIDADEILKDPNLEFTKRGVKLSNGLYLPPSLEREPPSHHEAEKEHLLRVLIHCHKTNPKGGISYVAKILDIERQTVHSKIRKYGITKDMYQC